MLTSHFNVRDLQVFLCKACTSLASTMGSAHPLVALLADANLGEQGHVVGLRSCCDAAACAPVWDADLISLLI